MNFPVDFEQKAQAARSASGGGYPVQISAADLMANFAYAALDAKSVVQGDPQPFSTTQENQGGNKTVRFLTLNPPPPHDSKKYTFAFLGGKFDWVPAIASENLSDGQMAYWSEQNEEWICIKKPGNAGEMLFWDEDNKVWQLTPAPTSKGEMLVWNADNKVWQLTPAPPDTGTYVFGAVNGTLTWLATEEC